MRSKRVRNAVCTGTIQTPMLDHVFAATARAHGLDTPLRNPMGGSRAPREVA
jgi:NAD(P)-dependent dehydrogenase (short-subunit alcohol dehydrogenase family)